MRELFWAANIVIAIDYFLIGWLFLSRIRMRFRQMKTHPRSFGAIVALVVFFFGCVHTHVDLVVLDQNLSEHWYHWDTVLSHWLQALGGLFFWHLARKYLVINIYDRRLYELSADEDAEARLQYLALKAGLLG